MSPGKPQKKSPFSGLTGGNFGSQIGLIIGGAVLLMIIVGVVLSFIPSSLNTQDLTTLAEAQNGLLTMCADGTANAKQQPNMNFAQNCFLVLSTDQQDLKTYTADHGLKLSSKTLALGVNPQTTAALKASLASSTYDATFTPAAQNQLNLYMSRLKSTFKDAKSSTQKQLLSSAYTNAQLLNSQLGGDTSTSS